MVIDAILHLGSLYRFCSRQVSMTVEIKQVSTIQGKKMGREKLKLLKPFCLVFFFFKAQTEQKFAKIPSTCKISF